LLSSEGQPAIRLASDRDQWEHRVTLMGVEGIFGPNDDLDELENDLDEAGDRG
jgi:hypothetical protein